MSSIFQSKQQFYFFFNSWLHLTEITVYNNSSLDRNKKRNDGKRDWAHFRILGLLNVISTTPTPFTGIARTDSGT